MTLVSSPRTHKIVFRCQQHRINLEMTRTTRSRDQNGHSGIGQRATFSQSTKVWESLAYILCWGWNDHHFEKTLNVGFWPSLNDYKYFKTMSIDFLDTHRPQILINFSPKPEKKGLICILTMAHLKNFKNFKKGQIRVQWITERAQWVRVFATKPEFDSWNQCG